MRYTYIDTTNILIKAEIIFYDTASKWVGFPVKNNLRLSLWEKTQKKSAPSEFHFSCEIDKMNVTYICEILIIKTDYLNLLKTEDEFCFGLLHEPCGEGKVIERIY